MIPLRRLSFALWCALALLGAQALGQWHGTRHAAPALHGAVEAHAHAHAHDAAEASHEGHAPGSAECRLWDQLLQADGPPLAAAGQARAQVPALPVAVAVQAVWPVPVWRQTARGPPGPSALS